MGDPDVGITWTTYGIGERAAYDGWVLGVRPDGAVVVWEPSYAVGEFTPSKALSLAVLLVAAARRGLMMQVGSDAQTLHIGGSDGRAGLHE